MTIFNRKKPAHAAGGNRPVMRGRQDDDTPSAGSNPLARRLLSEDEPDTIDLAGGAGFPVDESAAPEEPETRAASTGPAQAESASQAQRHPFLSQDPQTGKFYVQAGTGDNPVYLGDEVVTAPTELRRGDRIRVGDSAFEFLL